MTICAEHAMEQVLVWLALEGGFAGRDALLGAPRTGPPTGVSRWGGS